MHVNIELLSENAKLPTRGSSGAAGFDLYAADTKLVGAMTPTIVPTDLKIEIPPGFYGRIAPRSGLSVKGIDVMGGVIDSDYRGPIGVILVFFHIDPEKHFVVNKGDRIAQLIIEPCATDILWVQGELKTDTARAQGGFGSTGV